MGTGAMAAGSPGTGTGRYADAAVPGRKALKGEAVRVKPYLKRRILAVIGLRAVLS